MSTLSLAESRYRSRRRLARAAEAEARRLWRQVDPDNLASWAVLLPRMLMLLTAAQLAAAEGADAYVDETLGTTDAGSVNAHALAGVASDGRDLAGLLWAPAVATKVLIGRGVPLQRALAGGQSTLRMITRTQVADAGRVADGVAIATRPRGGYVRMLVGKSCSRCAVLAGKYFKSNAGFDRHPGCDCVHVPAKSVAAAEAEGLISDPREYFDSLSRADQDKIFTNAGAQAIRDGADIGQIVNVRRGAAGLTPAGARITAEEARMLRGGRDVGRLQTTNVFGREVFVSTEGTTTRGIAGVRLGAKERGLQRGGDRYRHAQVPRLMPESIYQLAESREHVIVLLRKFGYIL